MTKETWIKHTPPKCPVPPETFIAVTYADKSTDAGSAKLFNWGNGHGPLVKDYRIIRPADDAEFLAGAHAATKALLTIYAHPKYADRLRHCADLVRIAREIAGEVVGK